MKKKDTRDIVALGMTEQQIVDTANSLYNQTDNNHPTRSGSYTDFISAVDSGRKMLSKHKSYTKKQ